MNSTLIFRKLFNLVGGVFLLLCFSFFSALKVHADPSFSGGTGVPGDPYQIATCSELAAVNTALSSSFILLNDLNCTADGNAIIIALDNVFTGSFNGAGYSITLNINAKANNTGLFSSIQGGTVSNLRLLGSVIVPTDSYTQTGALAGSISQNSQITNVANWASVEGYYNVGGLIGVCTNSTINNVYNAGAVTSRSSVAGGICGFAGGVGTIMNSYNRGKITGQYHVGGLMGQRGHTTIEVVNNFNAGKINPTRNYGFQGGLWGNDVPGSSGILTAGYTNNFFDRSRSGYNICGYDNYGYVISPVSGKCDLVNNNWSDPSIFKGNSTNTPLDSWDFDTVWETVSNGYPALVSIFSDNVPVNDNPVAAGVPTNLTLSEKTPSYIAIQWTAPEASDVLPILKYEVNYKIHSDNTWTTEETYYPTFSAYYLESEMEYDFRVRAYNDYAWGDYSDIFTESTLRYAGKPTDVQVVAGSQPNFVTISWEAPADNGGSTITDYVITIKRSIDTWDNYFDSFWVGSDDTSYTDYEYLNSGTSYDFRIQGYNGDYGLESDMVTYITPEGPTHHITTCQELQEMNEIFDENWSATAAKIILDNDIDCSETREWNDDGDYYLGFMPLYYFEGIFDGQGYAIKNLYINRPEDGNVGLFESLGDATFQNLKLADNEINGYEYVGMLAGNADEGTVTFTNIDMSGGAITGYEEIGGLIGTVYDSYMIVSDSSIDVSIEGDYNIGGLAGYLDESDIEIEYTTVSGSILGSSDLGGMVGYSNDEFSCDMCSSTVDITGVTEYEGDQSYSIGGLIGSADEVYIENSSNSGNLIGDYRIGGLVGYLDDESSIDNSSNSGNITAAYRAGGLIGSGNDVEIERSFNTGSVTAAYSGEDSFADFKGVGGLVGIAWDIYIDDSFNAGPVNGTGTLYVGGLVGAGSYINIDRSYNTASVTGDIVDHDYNGVGGIIGASIESYIDDSYNDGSVTGKVRVGGLAGFSFIANVYNSYNAAAITYSETDSVGGLIGQNSIIVGFGDNYGLTMDNSFNTGEIIGPEEENVMGGLIGYISDDSENKNIYLTNNWWCSAIDDGIGYNDMIESQQSTINGAYEKALTKDVFQSNTTNEPVNQWDFEYVWHSKAGGYYPRLDLTRPVIELLGNNPDTMNQNSVYVDAGATAMDDLDGDISDQIEIEYNVNNSYPGSYYIYYSVEDSFGNISLPVRRNVVVQLAPSVTPSVTPTVTPTITPTVIPTVTATITPTPTTTPKPTTKPLQTATPTPTPQDVLILLNDFETYLDGTGKNLDDLKVGQVIKFNVDDENHSATIKTITDSYVIITLASQPFDVQISTGDTKRADVTGDGINDIEFTLNSINDGNVDMTFAELKQVIVSQTPVTENEDDTPTITKTTVNSETNNENALPVILFCAISIGLIATVIFVILKKNKNEESK